MNRKQTPPVKQPFIVKRFKNSEPTLDRVVNLLAQVERELADWSGSGSSPQSRYIRKQLLRIGAAVPKLERGRKREGRNYVATTQE